MIIIKTRAFQLTFLLLVSIFVSAQKTDKVLLKNGDVLTGEIKNLKFGKLRYDVTGPGVIEIKWEEIVKLASYKRLQITMRNGDILIASLDSSFLDKQHASLDDIVEIVQIKDRFLQRLDGNINLGFNFSKSNHILQSNFNSNIAYRKPKVEITLLLNSAISSSTKDTVVSTKQDATFDYYRTLNNRYYLNSKFGWQQSTQLGLQNRFILNAVSGKILVNDNHHRLLTGAGVSYNVEQSRESNDYTGNVESLAIIQFKKFRHSSPKISIDAQYIIFPGLSDWGRIRMDFQFNARIEVLKDFFVGAVFYDLYDSRPPSGAVTKNDYGINFTLGFEFGK